MTINQLISDALRMIGRNDFAEQLEANDGEGEVGRAARTLLFCYNAVADELARCYFPLKKEETLTSSDGRFAFESFSMPPVKIIDVTADGKRVEWDISPGYLVCEKQTVNVVYNYAPPKAEAVDEFLYPDAEVGARMVCYGMAAEYFLICGEVSLANAWEQRYRGEIDSVLGRRTVKDRVPPRRWL